jgi:hypothetical protein
MEINRVCKKKFIVTRARQKIIVKKSSCGKKSVKSKSAKRQCAITLIDARSDVRIAKKKKFCQKRGCKKTVRKEMWRGTCTNECVHVRVCASMVYSII